MGRLKYSWLESEEDFIKNNFLYLSDLEMSIKLKRTKTSVTNRRLVLKLIRPLKRSVGYIFNAQVKSSMRLRREWLIHVDMKALIICCELEENNYQRDKYKSELLRLSNLKQIKF